MKNIIDYLATLSGFLLLGFFFEGALTMGAAFELQNYNIIGWIIQGLIFIIILAITNEVYYNSTKRL